MSLDGATDYDKFQQLCSMTYKDQAIWALNGCWGAEFNPPEEVAETLWNYVAQCNEIDLQHHDQGSALDEMQAHVFLEKFKLTQTVREMRESLRASGAMKEKERVRNVPLTHLLVFLYKLDYHKLVNSCQGDNQEAIAKAQAMLDEVRKAFEAAEARANEAAEALRAAHQREAAAKQAELDAIQAEKDAIAAKEELEVALAELKAQEDAYNNKTKELEAKSETGGVVSRNKAKNELAQHLGEDPLPLRRAKITQEAAVKKADRTRQAAAEARVAAEEARAESERAKAAAEAAMQAAADRVREAEEFLEAEKKKPGAAQGKLWFMSRQVTESRKFLPESKGGIRRNRK